MNDTTTPESDMRLMLHTMVEERLREITEAHKQELALRDAQLVDLQNQLSFGAPYVFLFTTSMQFANTNQSSSGPGYYNAPVQLAAFI